MPGEQERDDQLGIIGGLDKAFMQAGNSSFSRYLAEHAPEMLTSRFQVQAGSAAGEFRHGTTILATTFADGVIMAADRQVTSGSTVSSRYGEKIIPADDHSCIGTAGTAALGVEIAKLFQVELEHYEKIEGSPLSLAGKANRLSKMIYENVAMAMQGLSVVPLFTGFDPETGTGKIFSYDALGGRTEEYNFHSIGSGSIIALGALKKLYAENMTEEEALLVCIQSIYDAGEEDIYTMGYDLTRAIFPTMYITTAEGNTLVSAERVGELVRSVVDGRMRTPDGPRAEPR
jgi:proteasome beta subunit